MSPHTGPVAIVTGAASGIGRATVDRLVAARYAVVAVDQDEGPSDEHVIRLAGDVCEPALNEEAVTIAVEQFGGLDAVVLNAGVSVRGSIGELPLDDFDRAMDVNVRSVAIGIRAAIPSLEARGGGAIAVTASTSGLGGDPEMWAYNASKGAVVNLVRSAALDLGPLGIRVNAVAPGPTETAMTRRIQDSPEIYEVLRRRMALQRWAQPDEIAAVLTFLVSPDASIITGAVIPADGGMTASTGQFLPKESP